MKAMIFAAGLGTRLRPLTNDRPKALVEVAGQTMLERVLRRVVAAGFTDVTINIHHFGQKIIDFLEQKGNFGATLHISDERDLLLDTGGGILKARPYLDGDEPFLVHNVDILCDASLNDMYQAHLRGNALATLLVKQRETQRYLLFDNNYTLRGWVNKSTGETSPEGFAYKPGSYREHAFGGVHIISPAIFPILEEYSAQHGKVFSITPFYTGECNKHTIKGYEPASNYMWFDIGKPSTLEQAAQALQEHSSKTQ